MKEKIIKNKKLILNICAVFVLMCIVVGISFAGGLWSYISSQDNVISAGENISLTYLESTNEMNLTNALPKSDKDGKLQTEKGSKFEFAITTTSELIRTLSYDIEIEPLVVDTAYTGLDPSAIKVYLEEKDGNSLVEPTKISDLEDFKLYTDKHNHTKENSSMTTKYTLKAWIDKDVEATNWYKDLKENNKKYQYKFRINIKAKATEYKNEPNAPVLDDAMIPVYYDETSETWKKADSSNNNNNWYDYDSKKWANSVTVSSTNRGTYKSASVGTEIPMDDILTMQVWIPRYKYKVWNYNADGTKTSSPQAIEITWEGGTSKTGEITCTDSISGTDGDPSETCKVGSTTCTDSTCNNKTYTHPAFTFGDKEIKGFWIGKFEVSATTSLDLTTISYKKEKHENENITANNIAYYSDDDEDIIVKKMAPGGVICTTLYDGTDLYSCSDTYFTLTKPNIHSWTNGTVKLYEDSIMNMKNSSNSYGLSTSTDTHMIKNMEWGAVAYLSHSKYGTCIDGTCTEIGINNNYNNMTGCGAIAGSSSSSTCNAYNTTTGMLASTTQNIYGVYDMSGGVHELTMANIVNTDGTTMIPGDSEYTTTTYPGAKYYDKYSYSASNTTRKRSKLGDGIKEVYNGSEGWYSDFSYLAYSRIPCFIRGGYFNVGADAGMFYSNYSHSGSDFDSSSRPVITP